MLPKPEQKARLSANLAPAAPRRTGLQIRVPRELLPDGVRCGLREANLYERRRHIGGQMWRSNERLSQCERPVAQGSDDESADNRRIVAAEVGLPVQPMEIRGAFMISRGLPRGTRYRGGHRTSLPAVLFIGMNKHNESYWKQNFARNTVCHFFAYRPLGRDTQGSGSAPASDTDRRKAWIENRKGRLAAPPSRS